MAAITVEELKQIKKGSIVYYVEENENYNSTTDMAKEVDVPWNALAQTSEFVHSTSTETDEFTYFAWATKTFNKETNEEVDQDTFKATCREFTPFFNELKLRLGPADANGRRKLFSTNVPSRRVWVMVEKYENGVHVRVDYMYADIRVDGDVTENNKYIRPTILLEIQPSEFNVADPVPAPTP